MSEANLPLDSAPAPRLTGVQWLICAIAAIGFLFDIYVLLMLPLIIKPTLLALGGIAPGTPAFSHWARLIFFVPAIVGGVFGLLGGYLTDLLGRRRVLTASIFLYAVCTFASAYATSLPQFLVLRCGVFVGVCVEFVAAVAWLAELFPNSRQREHVLGYTQAFSSFGGVMSAGINFIAAGYAASFPAIHGQHEAWRYTLMSGLIPAIPLILIRPFLPESPAWQQKKAAGTLKRPSFAELFRPALRRTTIMTTIVFAASYGLAFGAIQQLPQIIGAPVGGHKQIADSRNAEKDKYVADLKAKHEKPDPDKVKEVVRNASDKAVATVASWQETGGLFGRVALAVLAVWIVSRRKLLRIFQIPSLIILPLFFWWLARSLQGDNLYMVKAGIFLCGFFVVAQFSFWGNYIPLVFPLHLRGTGESFAANIGGRILGTMAAWITLTFAATDPGAPPNPARTAYVAAIVAGAYALIGAICTQWLPEPADVAPEQGAEGLQPVTPATVG
jgi:MFS family permease